MLKFILEWIDLRSPLARAIDARAVTDRIGTHEALIVPLVLLVALLFALGTMTGAPQHTPTDRTSFYASFGSMGMPTLSVPSDSCRRPLNVGSTPRLRHADVLALLAND
ncbi:hypothetical protein [Bradyrhizobium arachidis]|uniref:Uncharacterized protein n=1 Tax=Bradyrhizobium arachidis TaxID=858423 RepID=A0AAE7THB1_9BRAD|nr:hypothetical protein [Bradyrhizobium arachidis]QOZ68320.1 hypothetical protein WN72_19925 [Bradyrhizobium arachidis]SFV02135.1 hypothetical protein SAMN05192541_1109 [Bradyrhizobium arachidis]